jgi:hypothetical protein
VPTKFAHRSKSPFAAPRQPNEQIRRVSEIAKPLSPSWELTNDQALKVIKTINPTGANPEQLKLICRTVKPLESILTHLPRINVAGHKLGLYSQSQSQSQSK